MQHPLLQFIRIPRFQQLIAYCRTHPRDTTCRGALADWLEESSESEYAAYMRYECKLWEVISGYNYNKYKEKVNHWSDELFAKIDTSRSRNGIETVQQLGLLREVRISSLDNWLTFGKLAYAVGCVRRVEIVETLVPMVEYGDSGWYRLYSEQQGRATRYGYAFNKVIMKNLFELVETKDFEISTSLNGHKIIIETEPSRTQTKLLKSISRAAILHAKHSAIADGIACE